MARLIADAAELSDTVDAQSMSFDNVVEAIHVMQMNMEISGYTTDQLKDKLSEMSFSEQELSRIAENMGITYDEAMQKMKNGTLSFSDASVLLGTTAKEAGTTIQGSVASMKSAWTNLLTGLADGSADIGELIDNLVTTIVGDGTESNLGVLGNILPAIERALGGVVKLISGAAPKIIEILPGLIDQIVPPLIEGATSMVGAVIDVLPDLLGTVVDALVTNAPLLIEAAIGLVESLIAGIQENYQLLVDGAIGIVTQLATGILNMLPQIVALGLDLIVSLANGITQSLPSLLPTVMNVIMELARMLTDPATLTNILNAAMLLIQELSYGLVDAIPQLVQAALMIIENLCMFLLDPQNLATLLKMAFDIIVGIGTGLINAIPELLKSVTRIITGIIALFKDADWGKIGKDLVAGFKSGISRAWSSLKTWFTNLFGDLIDIAKKILGIASPSKVFKKIGGFTAEGFGVGFEDEFAHVKDDMKKALTFEEASIGINASIKRTGAGQGAFGSNAGGVSIVQNIYSEAKTAADLMQAARYEQEKAVFLGV